jgi:hypothetical protein
LTVETLDFCLVDSASCKYAVEADMAD